MSRSVKKGPFVDLPLLEKIEVMNRSGDQEGHQDLVPPVHRGAGDDRTHGRGSQRQEVRAGVRH